MTTYPTGDRLANLLVRWKIIDRCAVEDPDGFDHGRTLDACYAAARELRNETPPAQLPTIYGVLAHDEAVGDSAGMSLYLNKGDAIRDFRENIPEQGEVVVNVFEPNQNGQIYCIQELASATDGRVDFCPDGPPPYPKIDEFLVEMDELGEITKAIKGAPFVASMKMTHILESSEFPIPVGFEGTVRAFDDWCDDCVSITVVASPHWMHAVPEVTRAWNRAEGTPEGMVCIWVPRDSFTWKQIAEWAKAE